MFRRLAALQRSPKSALEIVTRRESDQLAPGAGRHAAYLMAVIEGLTANHLLHTSNRMTQAEITASLENMLREATVA